MKYMETSRLHEAHRHLDLYLPVALCVTRSDGKTHPELSLPEPQGVFHATS